MSPKRTRQNQTKVDQTRSKVVIHNIPRAEGVAQDLKTVIREMGFVVDDLVVPRRGDQHRAIGFLYLREESGLGEVATRLDGSMFKERRLEAHAEYENLPKPREEPNVDTSSKQLTYQFDDDDEYGSMYEERNVTEKRSRGQSSNVVNEEPRSSMPGSQEMFSDELDRTTAQLREAWTSCEWLRGQHEGMVVEWANKERELRELRQWKIEAEKRIERLEQEAASLGEKYHLICNRTPAELRVQIESVSQANARLISMLASKPRESPVVPESIGSPELELGLFNNEEDLNNLSGALPNLELNEEELGSAMSQTDGC